MKIAVLVSGGVDSSVALRLLKDRGHDLTAFYLKIWLEDELSYLGSCPWEEDLAYVTAVCEQAGVPLRVVNLQQEYREQVVFYVLEQIKKGLTPNPDVLCNKEIKFGAFFNHIGTEFDYVATGHYAKIEHGQETRLLRTPDAIKDQTYFLCQLSAQQLKKSLFPLGDFTKNQVRELAQQYDLANKDRKDSQGICFLGKIKFSDFIRHHVGDDPGDIVEAESGAVLGKHKGLYYFTIGQRQGSGLSGGPWFVVKKELSTNRLFVSKNYYDEQKKRDSFVVSHCNWINEPIAQGTFLVKLRHGPALYAATITPGANGSLRVQLDQNDQGIAPGQFAVFYDNDRCLGSGVIVDEQ
jgi:tRNA (5-methylaminomethyl-2-thiouridylate)-methyltransferase